MQLKTCSRNTPRSTDAECVCANERVSEHVLEYVRIHVRKSRGSCESFLDTREHNVYSFSVVVFLTYTRIRTRTSTHTHTHTHMHRHIRMQIYTHRHTYTYTYRSATYVLRTHTNVFIIKVPYLVLCDEIVELTESRHIADVPRLHPRVAGDIVVQHCCV